MKNNLLKLSGMAVAVLLSMSVFAQEERESKSGDNDVLIITKKGLKDGRIVIEIRDGEITVNGKPVDEYKDGDVTVRRSTGRALNSTRVYSPFRVEGQTWNQGNGSASGTYNGNADLFMTKPGGTAYLGVVTEKSDDGAKITSISDNTAAEKAGLKEGDVITHIDEDRIDDHDDLTKAIRKHKPGDKINVTVERDGRERQLMATLGSTNSGNTVFANPKVYTTPKIATPDFKYDFKDNFDAFGNGNQNRVFSYSGRVRLGIRAQDTEDGRGAKVLNVDNDSPADKAGIREGDVITQFEGKDINDADDLVEAARSVKDQSSMTVRLQRDGRSQTVEVKVAKKLKTTNL